MIESNSVMAIPEVRKYFIDLLINQVKRLKAEEIKNFALQRLMERLRPPILEIFHEDIITLFNQCRNLRIFQGISFAFSNPEVEPLNHIEEINPIRAGLFFHIAEHFFEQDKNLAYQYYRKAAKLKHPQAKITMNTEPFFDILKEEARVNFLKKHSEIKEKQWFQLFRSTTIKSDMTFEAILAHAMTHKSRTRDIFYAKGWLTRGGHLNINNAPPFVVQAAQKNGETLVIDMTGPKK